MEPKLPGPNFRPEQSPVERRVSFERNSSFQPEARVEYSPENTERGLESNNVTTPVLPPPIVVSNPTSTPQDSGSSQVISANPLVANDDDLIEKEWVDKAKKIIVETKDDPYAREQEVGKLQADYLHKRYGRELGTPS